MIETAMPRLRPLSPKSLLWTFVAATFVFAGVVGAWSTAVPEGEDQPLGLTLFVLAGVLVLVPGAIYSTLKHWRGLDEAAREAHKWAWYWGGSLGILPGLVIALTRTTGVEMARALGFTEPHDLIEFGALAVLISMLIGYLIAWGFWWLRRR
jgi:hypothetical protein